MHDSFLSMLEYLHSQSMTKRSKLMALLSVMMTLSASQLLQFTVPMPHIADLMHKQLQLCAFLRDGQAPFVPPEACPAPAPGALQSPFRARKLAKANSLNLILPKFAAWLTDKLSLFCGRTFLECGEMGEAHSICVDVAARLDLSLPGILSKPAILSFPGAPAGPAAAASSASAAAEAMDDMDGLGFALDILAAAAAGQKPSAPEVESPADVAKRNNALKADTLLLFADVVLAQRDDGISALTCFQGAVGLLEPLVQSAPSLEDGTRDNFTFSVVR